MHVQFRSIAHVIFQHCVKSVQIWRFFLVRAFPYFLYTDQEKLEIWTLFTKCKCQRNPTGHKKQLIKKTTLIRKRSYVNIFNAVIACFKRLPPNRNNFQSVYFVPVGVFHKVKVIVNNKDGLFSSSAVLFSVPERKAIQQLKNLLKTNSVVPQ